MKKSQLKSLVKIITEEVLKNENYEDPMTQGPESEQPGRKLLAKDGDISMFVFQPHDEGSNFSIYKGDKKIGFGDYSWYDRGFWVSRRIKPNDNNYFETPEEVIKYYKNNYKDV